MFRWIQFVCTAEGGEANSRKPLVIPLFPRQINCYLGNNQFVIISQLQSNWVLQTLERSFVKWNILMRNHGSRSHCVIKLVGTTPSTKQIHHHLITCMSICSRDLGLNTCYQEEDTKSFFVLGIQMKSSNCKKRGGSSVEGIHSEQNYWKHSPWAIFFPIAL